MSQGPSPHTKLKLVSVETPYAPWGETDEEQSLCLQANLAYALEAMKDSIMRKEAPYLSHLLYTLVLDDTKLEERLVGLALGHAWRMQAELFAIYVDRGLSNGMKDAIALAEANSISIEYRRLHNG